MTIPDRLYLDTQFCFAYHVARDPDHERADAFALALKLASAAGLVSCLVSVVALDELAWNLAGVLHDREHAAGAWSGLSGRAKRVGFDEMRVSVASVIEDFLAEPWIEALEISGDSYTALPRVMRDFDLRPADLCHLALAWAADCGIVTNDRDFHALTDLPVAIVGY